MCAGNRLQVQGANGIPLFARISPPKVNPIKRWMNENRTNQTLRRGIYFSLIRRQVFAIKATPASHCKIAEAINNPP